MFVALWLRCEAVQIQTNPQSKLNGQGYFVQHKREKAAFETLSLNPLWQEVPRYSEPLLYFTINIPSHLICRAERLASKSCQDQTNQNPLWEKSDDTTLATVPGQIRKRKILHIHVLRRIEENFQPSQVNTTVTTWVETLTAGGKGILTQTHYTLPRVPILIAPSLMGQAIRSG